MSFLGDMVDNLSLGAPLAIPLNADVSGTWNSYKI